MADKRSGALGLALAAFAMLIGGRSMEESHPSPVTPVECREKDEAATPIGDFLAEVAAAITVIFAFLTLYTTPVGVTRHGYQEGLGIVMLVVGAIVFLFAGGVMTAKLANRDFWLARSPGWVYGAGALLIILFSIFAMVFHKGGYTVNWGVPIVQFFMGVVMAVGAMLKFY